MNFLNKFNDVYFSNFLFKNENKLKYSFSFISLITPLNLFNLRLFFNLTKSNKIFLKQSYLLLTWFFYLSFLKKKENLFFLILPIKRNKFTLTKSPMAHKNWSKEQYKFQFYKIKLSFNSTFLNRKFIDSVNAGMLFIFLNKKFFPQFETNLLFLKSNNIFFYLNDKMFFNFYIFYFKNFKFNKF